MSRCLMHNIKYATYKIIGNITILWYNNRQSIRVIKSEYINQVIIDNEFYIIANLPGHSRVFIIDKPMENKPIFNGIDISIIGKMLAFSAVNICVFDKQSTGYINIDDNIELQKMKDSIRANYDTATCTYIIHLLDFAKKYIRMDRLKRCIYQDKPENVTI